MLNNIYVQLGILGIGWTGENTTVNPSTKGVVLKLHMNDRNQPKALVGHSG